MSITTSRQSELHPWLARATDQPAKGDGPLQLYFLFFTLLRISPTYELARKASNRPESTLEAASLPPDFDKVLETYRVLGDVRQTFFAQWWRKRGAKSFGALAAPQVRRIGYLEAGESLPASPLHEFDDYLEQSRPEDGYPETLLLAVPLGRADVLEELKRVVQAYAAALQPAPPKLQLRKDVSTEELQRIAGAVNRLTLWATSGLRMWEVEAECRPKNDPWVMGVNPGQWHVAKGSREDECRVNLATSLNRSLRRAERMAEHAARGRFPVTDAIEYPKYNYDAIGHRLRRIFSWEQAGKMRKK